ncbi:uncharacterized protein TNCV_4384211 [Trichonephila clavipes]|nr:uncharacterized protein TNCV_4384211 [Trichonephila clavipes]
MPREGAFHHLIIVSYPSQDKRSKGNGCAIQHDFMLLTVRKKLLVWLKNRVSPRSLKKKRHGKVRQFFDDFNADEKLQDRERLFEEDVFKANVDVITTQLKNRFESMNGIYKSFSFLFPKNIVSTTNDLLYNEASNLQNVYSLDLSSEFPNQIMPLKAVFSEDLIKLNSIKDLGNFLMSQNKFAAPSLPDVCIAVLLFLTLPVTSAMAERSFSKLKLIKNYLRCTMSEERLSYLSLISIEQQEARKIELDELITDFAKKNNLIELKVKLIPGFINEEFGRIIGKLEEGRSVTSVAAEFGIAHSIVSRLWRQFQTTGTAIRGFSSGRPRGTTPADNRYIVLQARRNRRQTAGEIARHTTQATGRPISRFTEARRLHGGGLFARRPVRCVPLTPAHRRRRSLWCREHRNWRDNEWGRVLFYR